MIVNKVMKKQALPDSILTFIFLDYVSFKYLREAENCASCSAIGPCTRNFHSNAGKNLWEQVNSRVNMNSHNKELC